MGERRGSGLAARFRARIDAARQAQERQVAAKKQREAQGRAERKRLLEDLAAFGEAVGHLNVTVGTDVVILGFGDNTLRFEAQGIADQVRVKGLEPEPRLFLHPELGRWVVRQELPSGREDQELLFDAGLERLIGTAFEIEPAEAGAEAADVAPAEVPHEDIERTL